MTPDQAANIYQSAGPIGLALIVLSLLVFALIGGLLSYVKWTAENMVPRSLVDKVLDDNDAAADRLCAQQHCALDDKLDGMDDKLTKLVTLSAAGGR